LYAKGRLGGGKGNLLETKGSGFRQRKKKIMPKGRSPCMLPGRTDGVGVKTGEGIFGGGGKKVGKSEGGKVGGGPRRD